MEGRTSRPQILKSSGSGKWKPDFKVVDANFDGYNDLMLLFDCGATGNCLYYFYIFDEITCEFYLWPESNKLSSPRFDADTRVIYTHSVGGMAGNIYLDKTFKIDADTLKLIHSVDQDFDQVTEHHIRKTKYIRNGRLVDSATIIFPPKKY